MESRTQGSTPKPRTQKKSEAEDSLSRPRTALSRPRTGMLEAKAKNQGHKRKFSPKNKVFKNSFQAFSSKKCLLIFFRRSTKFQQFKKKCCPQDEDRAIFEDLRPRGQGQGLQNVSSRPWTFSRTPPLLKTAGLFLFF